MKKINRYFMMGLLVSVLSFNPAAYASQANELSIINHFDQPLFFVITINPMTVPDLPTSFSLAKNEEIKTRVLDLKEAYIRTVNDNKVAFWGVNIEQNKVKVHGYISKGIAYSWNTQMIVFCTPDEYRKFHSCIH